MNLTVCGGVGAASGLAVRLLAKAGSVTPGFSLMGRNTLPLSVSFAYHNSYLYAWLFLVFGLSYSALDDFELFPPIFLQVFNLSFPAVIRVKPVTSRTAYFWTFNTICFLVSSFIAFDTLLLLIPKISIISFWLNCIKFSKSSFKHIIKYPSWLISYFSIFCQFFKCILECHKPPLS